MRWDLLSFESLKAYPWWLVVACVGVMLAALLAMIAKPLQWALYLCLGLVFLVIMGGFLAWLWT